MTPRPAEHHLQELGVSEPKDIDVEPIAYAMGALVKYEELAGCEASITGWGDRAIIKVDPRVDLPRRRFSGAHECGHWFHHRGRAFRCRADDIGNPRNRETHPERVADEYAADLLMPRYLFKPRASQFPHTSFKAIRELQVEFRTSLVATALRMVKYGPDPVILICHSNEKREWFSRSPGIHNKWFPRSGLDPDSYAYDILRGQDKFTGRRVKMPAEAWFDFRKVDDLEVFEETIRYGDRVLTLITIPERDSSEDG